MATTYLNGKNKNEWYVIYQRNQSTGSTRVFYHSLILFIHSHRNGNCSIILLILIRYIYTDIECLNIVSFTISAAASGSICADKSGSSVSIAEVSGPFYRKLVAQAIGLGFVIFLFKLINMTRVNYWIKLKTKTKFKTTFMYINITQWII
jgi:hypothetical protein